MIRPLSLVIEQKNVSAAVIQNILLYLSSSVVLPRLSQGLGNLGLQNFHQRTLSASSSATAKITCFAAAFIVPTLGIPPILLGAVAASTGTAQEQSKTTLVILFLSS